MREARRMLDTSEVCRYMNDYNYTCKARSVTVLKCSTHNNCGRPARITQQGPEMFALRVMGEHNTDRSDTPRTGIDKRFELEVDSMLLGGASPSRCLMLLSERYENDTDLRDCVPDLVQLKNRRANLLSNGQFDVSTMAELMEWVASKKCTTREQFHRYDEGNDMAAFSAQDPLYQDALIVLNVFHEELDDNNLSLGIICTSRRLFRNILLARVGHRYHGIPGSTDGTYRLAANYWTLVAFGSSGVEYNGSDGYSHRFYPFAYMFVRSETARAYSELFRVVKEKSKLFFVYTLTLQLGSLDHADSIANAYQEHWDDIVLLSCWPHLAGNLLKKKNLPSDGERYEGTIKSQVDYLHESRSASQFRSLAGLVTKNWIAIGEQKIASWFKEQYLSRKWKLWYYAASKVAGVIPNQNAIESHNRDIKRVVDSELYASTKVIVSRSLPRIVAHFGTARDRNLHRRIPYPITPYAVGTIPIECARKADILTEEGNFGKLENRAKTKVMGILFNVRAVMIGGEAVNPTPIDEGRVLAYNNSRRGRLDANDGPQHIQQHYLSLHLTKRLNEEAFANEWDSATWSEREILRIRRKFTCDCKAFFESGWLCAHVLASLKNSDNFDLKWLLKSLPARNPPGRPRKAPKTKKGDGPNDGQYSVSRVIERLTRSPGAVVGWNVMVRQEETNENGDVIFTNLTGVIRPWTEEQERYFWAIEFDRQAAPDVKVDIEELARANELMGLQHRRLLNYNNQYIYLYLKAHVKNFRPHVKNIRPPDIIINYTYRSKYPFIRPS